MRNIRKNIGWWIAGILVLALVVFMAFKMTRPATVDVAEIQPHTVEIALSVVGRARPDDLVQVASPNPGQVIRLLADDGDQVTQGAALAVIRASVEQAQTEAEAARETAARADVTEAQLNFNRTKTLHDRGFAADAALDSARVSLQAAQANLRAAQAQVRASAEKTQEYTIRAPMNGVVLFRPIDNGQVVSAGETLFELGSSGGVEIRAEVEEVYADALKVGQAGRAALSGSDDIFAVRLIEVSPQVNASTGGRLIKLVPDTAMALSNGRSIDLTVVVDRLPNALSVPRRAIVDASAAAKVLVVGADNVVEARPVTLLRWPSTNAVITSGLKAGDRIVLDPAGVKEGQRIRPVFSQER